MTYLLASFALIAIAALDYLTGVELMMSPFYAVPCLLMDWRIGRVSALMYGVGASYIQWLVGMFGGHPYSHQIYFYWDLILNLFFYGALIWIVAKLRFALEMERVLSRGDFLTRVANRKLLQEVLDSEIQRCRRHGHALTLISVDCDDFKSFNEQHGHSVGDLILQAVADTLKRTFRGTDWIARSGDDEFTVVLPEMPPEHAKIVLEKIRAQLQTLTLLRGWQMTFSVAGSVFLRPDGSLDEVMGRHYLVLEQVKRGGKNGLLHRVWEATPEAAAVSVVRGAH